MRNVERASHEIVVVRLGLLASDHKLQLHEQQKAVIIFTMLKIGSKSNLEGEFQCKISLLDDTELSCDFKVRIVSWKRAKFGKDELYTSELS